MSRRRLAAAFAISALPLNGLRVAAYRLLGYRITASRIGIGTVIAVDAATIDGAHIGPINLFSGPITVVIGPGATIGNRNEFSSGAWVAELPHRDASYGRTLRIGGEANITCRHFFDVAGNLTIGERTWVAGLSSQFWTHGAGVRERDVTIGRDCYIGSVVRFAPGSSIGDNVLVAMGSVVTGRIDANDAMVGGVPAKVLKSGYDWRSLSAVVASEPAGTPHEPAAG